jgi:hypothetical protein
MIEAGAKRRGAGSVASEGLAMICRVFAAAFLTLFTTAAGLITRIFLKEKNLKAKNYRGES